jgi:hypothetical protein
MWLDKTSQIWPKKKDIARSKQGNLTGSWPKKKDKKRAVNNVVEILTEFWPMKKTTARRKQGRRNSALFLSKEER